MQIRTVAETRWTLSIETALRQEGIKGNIVSTLKIFCPACFLVS